MVRRALCSQLPQLQAMLLAVTSVHPLCLVHSNAYSDEGPLPYKLQSRSLLLILFPLCGCGAALREIPSFKKSFSKQTVWKAPCGHMR